MKNENNLLIGESLIDGKWRKSTDTFEVINPANNKTIAEVANFTVKEVKEAVKAADSAWKLWRNYTAEERGDILHKWYNLILQNKERLAEIITLESGKPLVESHGEISYGASFISWFAEEGKRAYGETIPSPNSANRIITIKQSIGVVAAITPWNFPLAMITRKVAPALAAGCTVVLRPASE